MLTTRQLQQSLMSRQSASLTQSLSPSLVPPSTLFPPPPSDRPPSERVEPSAVPSFERLGLLRQPIAMKTRVDTMKMKLDRRSISQESSTSLAALKKTGLVLER